MSDFSSIVTPDSMIEDPSSDYNSSGSLLSPFELARALVERTGSNIFLTGKAGTGKTTFLRRIQEESRKRMVVVAPTGIAAINAGGVTIHSFFQLDFNNSPNNFKGRRFDRFSKSKLNIIRSLDVLVIDEISMVRADLLDKIDGVLRRHRNPRRPFGGVQLLMIGDLHQLPPVVTEEEVNSVMERYVSPYFFESEALKKAGFKTIELTKIYRQTDERFIRLLNAIRTNRAGSNELSELNRCVGKNFRSGENFIRIVTHNRQAKSINDFMLSSLPGSPIVFPAKVEGKFPESSYPGDETLLLKKGAQVMFIKNDLQNHDWYNGLLAEVTDLSPECIRVRTTDGRDLKVRIEEWVNNSYKLDEKSGDIKEIKEGSFRQYPLRLAWAITVHKSQGLTFDRAVIDVSGSFAHGQTYVALSRCRSLEGLSLERPLSSSAIITDPIVEEFMASQTVNPVNEKELRALSLSYTVELLRDLFDFTETNILIEDLARTVSQFPQQYSLLGEKVNEEAERFRSEVVQVSRKFEAWFPHYAMKTPGIDADGKIAAGASYFSGALGKIQEMLNAVPERIQNKEVQKRLDTVRDNLRDHLYVRQGLLNNFSTVPFTPDAYVRLRSALQVKTESGRIPSSKATVSKSSSSAAADSKESLNPGLEKVLKEWRLEQSRANEVPAFRIMSNNALRSVANGLPEDLTALKSLKNIGEFIAARYGSELLNLVKEWKRNQTLNIL